MEKKNLKNAFLNIQIELINIDGGLTQQKCTQESIRTAHTSERSSGPQTFYPAYLQ